MAIIEIIKKMTINILVALYQPFGFAVLLAILFMFVYMIAKEHGWREIASKWCKEFKKSKSFRRGFLLSFYLAMILFRTLLNRGLWGNPFENVIGVWGVYNQDGEITTENIENILLFVPFSILVLWTVGERIVGKSTRFLTVVWKSTVIVFLFSLIIELLQVLLYVGTFQLSDLFYNTLGGTIGGLIFVTVRKVHICKRKRKEKGKEK